ncbi:4-azaleucine resistance probable transporter AzlC [Asanoa hainanensis]|uniref:4-azaleucine resistance probable transporter AzlC n=1 Tax=Asanoa hainanensis TaxID=560556 RepID=A0A239NB56_9ACTN|nr:AzlC family ABC transporter permease [Asanoa hainanensis]SNT52115.1 4-azaleucine resistance probable transporter AzlC [Asanoa hainanensis]
MTVGSILGDRSLVRDVGALGLAVFAVSISFGAIAVAAGIPAGLTILMSLLVFAGGSQFLAVGLIAAGNPFAAIFAGLLLNARHLPFGLAIGEVIGTRWWQRLVGAHLLIDESVAFALAQPDPARRRRAYWATGCTLFVLWNIGAALGVLLGNVGDPARLGLDAAFPAGLIALLLPPLRDPTVRLVALTGALVALVTTPILPAGLPVLLALTGLVMVAVRPRKAAS